jgi:hypothetical protein
LQGLLRGDNAELRAVIRDDANRRDTDLLVDPLLLAFDCWNSY